MARSIDYRNLDADDFEFLSTRSWLVTEGDYLGHDTSKQLAAWRKDGALPEPSGDSDEGDDEGIEYKDASVADLKAELVERGLPTDGKKAELVARLEADDADHADEDDDEEEDDEADDEETPDS